MNNIVCITTAVSVGATFVDWSVHFLSGKRKFYSVKNSAWLDLSNNPVQEINAHGHKKNHPGGHDSTWQYVEQLAAQSKTDLLSLYATCLPAWMAAEAQSISSPLDTKKHQQIVAYQKHDLEKLINSLMNAGIKVIYISLNKENILYQCVSRSLDRLYFADKVPASIDERNNHKDQLFFGDSITQWTDMGLTSKWDLRERLALSLTNL